MSSKKVFHQLAVGASFNRVRFPMDFQKFEKVEKAAAQPLDQPAAPGSNFFIPPPETVANFFASGEMDADEEKEEKTTVKPNQDKPVPKMSKQKIRNIFAKMQLKVTGSDAPQPIVHFSNLVRPPYNVQRTVVNNLFQRQHKMPTPIQCISIPALLSKRDVIACAPTGSGKTVAFLVPLFANLKEPNPDSSIRALIISPTKELAVQIEREAFLLMKGQRWKLVQHGQTTKHKDIFVTTPNRVVSLLKSKSLSLDAVEYIVFDEGDKLWSTETDFLQLMDLVLASCSKSSKVISFFSATLTPQAEQLIQSVMKDPLKIIVKGRVQSSSDVEQKLVFVGNELGKIVAIRNLIREGINLPALIFVQSIERTKELFDEINVAGLKCAIMNSKMSPEERDATVLEFRMGNIWVLITTELLARGIDFKNIGTVINFDFPGTVTSYVHRVGRTGRAGHRGFALTFFTEDDKERLPAVAQVIKQSGGEVEDWMLRITTSRKRKRQLAHETPQRMIVSTKKRILVGEQRLERQLKRIEKEKSTKGQQGQSDSDDSNTEA